MSCSNGDEPKSLPARSIVWTRRAHRDLEEIGDYIARDSAMAAARWLDKLIGAVEAAAGFPNAGRVVPEFNRPDIREVFCRSYRIVYQVQDDSIKVLTIFEGHRRMPLEEGAEG